MRVRTILFTSALAAVALALPAPPGPTGAAALTPSGARPSGCMRTRRATTRATTRSGSWRSSTKPRALRSAA